VPCLTHDGFKVWAGAHADIDHIVLARMPRRPWRRLPVRRPALHGRHHFAPVVTRFLTYYVKLESHCAGYCHAVMAMPQMQEWMDGAKAEPDEVVELDVEF
jgi:glutathione S-transferase